MELTFAHTCSLFFWLHLTKFLVFNCFLCLIYLWFHCLLFHCLLTLTCSIFSFLRWKESFCLPLKVIVGTKTDSVCLCCVCVPEYVCTLGVIVGLREKVYTYAVCICSHDVCIYFQRPKALGKCRVSLQPPVSASVSPLPCSPLLSSQQTETWCFSVLPWRVWLLPPDLHLERLLGLTMKENKTRTVTRAGILSTFQSTFFSVKRRKILDIRLYQHK